MIKFSTDGARLSNQKNAVQGCIKIIDVNEKGIPIIPSELPKHLRKEFCVFIFVGKLEINGSIVCTQMSLVHHTFY